MKNIKKRFRSIYTNPDGYESTAQMPSLEVVESTWLEIADLISRHRAIASKSDYWQSRVNAQEDWFKDQNLYILYADLFGGDFDGVRKRLDVLEKQGITLLHILPCMESPGRDKGFDVSDYMQMQTVLGGNAGFKRLVDACHARGIFIMIDWIVNHTSNQHNWAITALNDPHAPERGYYYFHHGVPTDLYRTYRDDQGVDTPLYTVFYDTYAHMDKEVDANGNPRYPGNWVLVGYEAGEPLYVYATFYHHQWDTNARNPRLLLEMLRIMLHWRQMGVDVFRLDAIPYWWKRNRTPCVDCARLFDLLRLIRMVNDLTYPQGAFLAEAMTDEENMRKYLGTPEAPLAGINYDFWLQHHMWYTAITADTGRLIDHARKRAIFLENNKHATAILFDESHDELNAEKDQDLEELLNQTYLASGRAQAFKEGVAARRVELLNQDPRRIALMDTLKYTLAGIPATYYGNEVGMPSDNAYMEQRWQDEIDIRLAESAAGNAPSDRATIEKSIPPDRRDRKRGPIDWFWYEKQQTDPGSLGGQIFATLTTLAHIRSRHVELRRGALDLIETDHKAVLAIKKTFGREMTLLIQNWSHQLLMVRISEMTPGTYQDLITERSLHLAENRLSMDPYQSLLLKATPVAAS